MTSPGEGVSVFTSPYLSAGAPALGEAKGLMNVKKEIYYNILFESIINIITHFRKNDIEINSVVSDSEKGLINTITKYFNSAQ